MKQPLAWLVIIFCLGILVAVRIKIPFWPLYFLAAIFLFLSFLSIRREAVFNIFLSCLIFCLGATFLKNSRTLPSNHISKYISYRSESPYIIKGALDSQPESKNNRTTFVFKTEELRLDNFSRKCSGKVIVYLAHPANFSYGDQLILKGNLYRPFGKNDRGRKSYREYLYNQGIFFIMNVKTDVGLVRLNKNKGLVIKRFALRLKNKIEQIIFRYTSPLAAGVLDAMVLGEKNNIPWFVNDAMMKTGTVHILPRLYTKMPSVAL
jgi:predicted membrane metal-binding protein